MEAFVRNFAKTYYSWSGNKDSVAQRTDALTGYLTEDLQRLTADTVRSDIAVSSSVQDVQIWSVEQNSGENDFAVVFTVAQTISDGKKKDTVSSVYKTMVHKADSMPPVKCADYTFSQLKSTVLNKNGDTVTETVAVEYLDSVTKMTQISQFELVLKLVDGNWKIVR